MNARAKETFHHSGGTEDGGTVRAEDHPLVCQFPSLYERIDEPAETPAAPAAPVKRPPGRPRKAVAGG